MRPQPPVLAALLAFTAALSAQHPAPTSARHPAPTNPGATRLTTHGMPVVSYLDLDTGVLTTPGGSLPPTPVCFNNSIDPDGVFDALLYPAGVELFDWGIRTCGGSLYVQSITIGYGSRAVPTRSGGPGGSLEVRLYERATGYGVAGTERMALSLTGLPSDGGPFPLLSPRILQINLGSQALFLPDGPIGWGYRNADGDTAPLLVDATVANGVENVYDVYDPGPAAGGTFSGTFQLPPGGASNDPFENSFYLKISQNDTPATLQTIAAGQNPNIFSAAGPPVVGAPWFPTVNTLGFPAATRTLVAVTAQRIPGFPTRSGQLVLDLGTQLFPISVKFGGIHRFDIPIGTSLIGLSFYAQGGIIGPTASLQLTNGLVLTIGTF